VQVLILVAGNGLISQFLTDVADPNRLEIPAGAWNFEMYFSASSSGGTPAFYVELLKYDGTTFTSIASSSAVPEAITSGTLIDLYLTSLAIPQTTLLSTDRLAIRVYIVNSTGGRTITMHTENSHLCEIITNFAGGVSALNGLTANTQYFATGTSGTDFAISSVGDTHTFNLPTASGTNRGALSSADWTTFNGKADGNIYTANGTLTANRTVSLSTFDLFFTGVTGTINTKTLGTNAGTDYAGMNMYNSSNELVGSFQIGGVNATAYHANNFIFGARKTGGHVYVIDPNGVPLHGFYSAGNVGINTGVTINASSQLQVDSTTKGFLAPRMTTTQKNAISSPATGLQVYDTTLGSLNVYNGTSWIALGAGGGGSMAIGGSITSATAGSVLFAGTSGVLAQDNANFFWDDTNNRLGIGTASPTNELSLVGSMSINTSGQSTTISNYKSAGSTGFNIWIGGGGLNSTTGGGAASFGSWNTSLGVSALLNTTTAEDSVAIGYFALRANTTGSYNTAVGRDALLANTTGQRNTGIGRSALGANTTGNFNTAIGMQSLLNNTTAADNTSIGYLAMSANTTGASNMAIGRQALSSNLVGFNNAAIGYFSLKSSTGNYNVANGANSLENITTGSSNIALGFNAGSLISGGTANTITNNSIFIGDSTKPLASNQTNQIVIGNAAIGLGSNTTVIGNSSTTDAAIYGRLLVNYSAPVIGTFGIDVNGTARIVSKLTLGAGTTSNAQINMISSTAPTSPNNGDIWFDGTDLKMRIGGVTKTFTLI